MSKVKVTLRRSQGYSLVIDAANGTSLSFDRGVPKIVSREVAERLREKAKVEVTFGNNEKEDRDLFDYEDVPDNQPQRQRYPEQAEPGNLPDGDEPAPEVPDKSVQEVAEENYEVEQPVETQDGTISAKEANALPDSITKKVAQRQATGQPAARPALKKEPS